MFGGQQGGRAAQGRGPVGGDERLVPSVGVAQQGPVDRCARRTGPGDGGAQRPYRPAVQERQVRGEDEHHLGVGVPQSGGQRGQRAAAWRFLAGPAHRPGGGPAAADHDRVGRVGAGVEHPVEQGPAADAQGGLVGAAEPSRGATGQHDRVVRHVPSMRGSCCA